MAYSGLPSETLSSIIADLVAGIAVAKIVEAHNVSKQTVYNIRNKNVAALERRTTQQTVVAIAPVDTISEAREQATSQVRAELAIDLRPKFLVLANLAIDRLTEGLKEGAKLPKGQAQLIVFTLERILPSADAKVQATASMVVANDYRKALADAVSLSPEEEREMDAIREISADVVAKRKPLIVNNEDRVQ